ncbi:type II toxin-antitoxin system ribonuclease VapC29 [Angustibacter peucedani]
MTQLLDGNVLVALSLPDHVHHAAADRWWGERSDPAFATCPITQGALVRIAVLQGRSAVAGQRLLARICAQPGHEFWPDDLGYQQVTMHGVIGHRQVTDAYLAELALRRSARLVTLDAGLAALHPDVAELVVTA